MESTIEERLQTLLNSRDAQGRRLEYRPEDDSKIYLIEDGKKEVRCLGKILIGQKAILYHKMEDERNIFKTTNSWSINYQILQHVDIVLYESLSTDYQITKERALEFGDFMHFIETTEKKLYIPLKYWDYWHKGMRATYPDKFRLLTLFGCSWYEKLKPALDSDFMKKELPGKLFNQRKAGITIYPDNNYVFRAFRLCAFFHTKVVIIGQDPYSNGVADGLAFSYKDGVKIQGKTQSLDVIIKEIERDIYGGFKVDFDYNLSYLARQGVLLLNSILTVQKGKPLSHQDIGWQRFTSFALELLLLDKQPKVYMLWGKVSQELMKGIINKFNKAGNSNWKNNLFLYAPHPASDLYRSDNTGEIIIDYPNTFSGNKHFSQANTYLKANGRKEIDW